METALTLNNLRTIVLVVSQHGKNNSEKQTAGWTYPLTIVEGWSEWRHERTQRWYPTVALKILLIQF